MSTFPSMEELSIGGVLEADTANLLKERTDYLYENLTSGLSAAQILAKLITVDGSGSELDADMLDGKHATDFAGATHRHTVDDVSGLLDALASKLNTSALGSPNGAASLDSNGKILPSQIPGSVDDVIEVADYESLPTSGVNSVLYVTVDTSKVYRWSGSTYIEISASPGSTDAVPEGTVNFYFTDERARAAVSNITGNAATADRLRVPRKIELDGDVKGETLFSGSGDVVIITTIADSSHSHPVSEITGLSPVAISGSYTDLVNIPTLADMGGQPIDDDLTAISALGGTPGLLFTDGNGTWSVDTSDYAVLGDDMPKVNGVSSPGVSALGSRSDHVHPITPTNLNAIANSTVITINSSTGSGATLPVVSLESVGLMSVADKTKLDGIESGATGDMTPGELLLGLKTVDGTGSGLDADLLDGKHASDFSAVGHSHSTNDINGLRAELDKKLDVASLGIPEGVAPLDASGKVAAVYLPSFVDDVREFSSMGLFPASGEPGVIYVDISSGLVYRWSGTMYAEISSSPGSSDAVPEGSVNLYFTAERVNALINSGDAGSASKLTSPFSLTLSGGCTGSASIDGSQDVTLSVEVDPNSHTHNITDLNGVSAVAVSGNYSDILGRPSLGTASALDAPLTGGDASETQVVLGNDSRLFDARPSSDVPSWAKQPSKPIYSSAEIGAQPVDETLTAISNIATAGYIYRNADGTVTVSEISTKVDLGVVYSDTNVTITSSTGDDAIIHAASATRSGLITPEEKIKLAGIEVGATGDMTGSEILSALLSVDGEGSGLNADMLDGNHASAFALVGHVHSPATTSADGFMTASHVSALNTAIADITALEAATEPAFTTLPVSKGGTGVNTLTGIAKFNGTSAISAATSTDILALVPDATTSQPGKMTTSQVSSLNELGGLVSMGSGVVKKTLSTTGLDTYATASISDLVTSTNPVTNLNADMLDGKHASAFALDGHTHDISDVSGFGSASTLDVPVSGNASTSQVVLGNDSRLTDARVPLPHIHTISDVTNLQSSLDNKIDISTIGSPNGIAPLDASRLIPSVYLPSFVDDVLEFASHDVFPATGESSKIYVSLTNSKIFRWSGSSYVEISASPGSTDSVTEGSVNLYFTDARARAAVTSISGNAATATKLQSPRSFTITGDVTSPAVYFDGSSSVSFVATVVDDSHHHTVSTMDGLGTVVTYDVPTSENASAGQVVLGNDTRLSDPRPASDVSAWAKAALKPSYTASEVGAQPLDSDLTSIASVTGDGVLSKDANGFWSLTDAVSSSFASEPAIYLGDTIENGINCNSIGYGTAVVSISSQATYNSGSPKNFDNCTFVYLQTIRPLGSSSGNGKIQIAWPVNNVGESKTVLAFRSISSNSITFSDWVYVTPSDYANINHVHAASDVGAQPLNSDLTALSNLTSTGIMVRTGTGGYRMANIKSNATALTITNGPGVDGNPTIDLDGNLKAIAALGANSGLLKKLSASTWTLDSSTYLSSVTLGTTQAASSVTITNNSGGDAVIPAATTSQAGVMSSIQVSSLNDAIASISALEAAKEPTIGTLPVSKGGTGVGTLTGIAKFNGTSAIQAATSTDIVALVPDATTLQAGKMTTSQVSSLNELGGLVSMGSGVVKKTLSTAGLDTYSTAVINDLVTSTNVVSNLNADMLDGNHASAFSLSGHSHGSLDSIAGTGVGLLVKTSTSGVGTYSSAQIASLTTTGLTVSGLSTNGMINLSLDTGLDNFAGFSDNSTNVGLVKLSAVNSFAKATSNDIVALMPDATASQAGKMTTAQVTSLNAAVSDISTLQTSKENAFTTLPVSKGGTGVGTLTGIAKFNGTSAIQAATSNDIVALVPDATTSQAGKMTTAQVSSLNDLGGLVSMGSGVVKKTLSTAGLDTYSTAVITDLVTSTNVVSNLNADMLDGLHVGSAASLSITHIPYVGGDGVIELGKYIDFHLAPGADYDLRLTSALNANGTANIPNLYLKGGSMTSDALIWHSGNDGEGSSLDADLLDGIQATGFLRSNLSTMFTGNNLTMATNLKYTPSSTSTIMGIVTYGVEDDTGYCRLRTYGRDSNDAITGARFGWSTGSRYINIDTKPDPILPEYDCINIYPTTTSAQVALRIDGNLVWHEGNDGPDSGLNADLIDNLQGSQLVRNDITNQVLKGFSLGAPAGTTLSEGIVFNRGNDNTKGWALKSYGTGTSPTFALVDTFTAATPDRKYEWSSAAYYPTATNTISLGSSTSKWTVVYATTGTINTSDARMKTSVEQFTQNELKASKLLADEIGLYQFLDSISTKGDQARRHVGMTVQRAIEIMTQCGLEPFDYGFICYDEWVDDSGETQSQYAFRYDQLNMFILRGISDRIKNIESAIS